jgi:hypothetical protein
MMGVVLLGGVLWTGLRNVHRRLLADDYVAGNVDGNIFKTFGIAYALAYRLHILFIT